MEHDLPSATLYTLRDHCGLRLVEQTKYDIPLTPVHTSSNYSNHEAMMHGHVVEGVRR